MVQSRGTRRLAPFFFLLLIVSLAACGGGHRLAEFSFADRGLAVAHVGPAFPEVLTGSYDVDTDDPIGAVIDAGSRAAKEVGARKARARLDSAASEVRVAERMAGRLLERASRYLGARPVTDASEADYLLELDLRSYGIDARGDDARLFVTAEAVLLERESGAEVWSTEVRGRDRLTPSVEGDERIPADVVTAGSLSQLSVEDLRRILRRLADVSAAAVVDRLRSDLRDVRREG